MSRSESKRVQKAKGSRAGWYKGGNSTLREHIASAHYDVYRVRCKEQGIEENWRCVPKKVRQARAVAAAAAEGKKGGQKSLDAMLPKVQGPQVFTPEAILKSVTRLIVCGQHVSFHTYLSLNCVLMRGIQAIALADDIDFRNCLVTMRPKTSRKELPTRTMVRARINNEFVDHLDKVKEDIGRAPGAISSGWDLWSAPHTSDHYFGMIAQWIEVDENFSNWVLRDEVTACHKIFGKHDGENLGKYLLLCLDRVGITSKTDQKVRHDPVSLYLR